MTSEVPLSSSDLPTSGGLDSSPFFSPRGLARLIGQMHNQIIEVRPPDKHVVSRAGQPSSGASRDSRLMRRVQRPARIDIFCQRFEKWYVVNANRKKKT